MKTDDDKEVPGPPEPPLPDAAVPARNVTPQELEAVIRRAVELQSRDQYRAEEGVPEADVVRIGRELGLEPAIVRRAMVEVRSRPTDEGVAITRAIGEGSARASRVLPWTAASTTSLVDRYLRETEFMVAQRRFPDRTHYVRDSSLAAGIARVARRFSRSQQPLDVERLDVAVAPLDEESCLLEVSVDMKAARAGTAAGAVGLGGALGSGLAVTIWATPIADPLMVLGLPVVAGAWYGMRAIYGAVRKSTQEKLEALLDRIEHSEAG
jgi:hypothetical protein